MKSIKIISSLIILSIFFILSCSPGKRNKISRSDFKVNLIDSLFNSSISNNEIPGAVAFIQHDGKIILNKAYGYRNLENKIPMQQNDIFRIASMTKGLTAVAILQLYERGLLTLDDELRRYIPEFSDPQILIDVLPDSGFISKPALGEITIRQLLTHTSGIGYGFQDDRYNALIVVNNISEGFEDDDRTSLENIKRLARIPLLFEPGEKYTYGLSMDVLGVVIEIISGMRYDQYIMENILNPLGMTDSYFYVPAEEQYRLVSIYQPTEYGTNLEPTTYPDTAYPRIENRQFFSGGSDMSCTAEDYGKFIQMLLNGGVYNDKRILGEEYVKMMLSRQSIFEEYDSYQGFAAWITNEKGAAEGPMAVGSFGFGGFWDTYGWTDPEGNFVAVLLLQMYPNNQYKVHERFQELTYRVINGSD